MGISGPRLLGSLSIFPFVRCIVCQSVWGEILLSQPRETGEVCVELCNRFLQLQRLEGGVFEMPLMHAVENGISGFGWC